MASIKKESNGKWSFRATTGSRSTRKQVYRRGFSTRREATQAATQLEASFDRGQNPQIGRKAFADYFHRWIDAFKIGKHSDSTDRWYTTVAGYIDAYYKDTPLNRIDRESYQGFIDWLGEKPRSKFGQPLSASTVRRANSYVRAVVKDAIEDGAIVRDFTRRVTLGGLAGKTEEEKYLSEADFKAVIRLAEKRADMRHMSNYILVFQAYTGARFEEALGLSWDRIDFDAGTIKFDRSWQYKLRQQYDAFGGLKNEPSYRTITMPAPLVKVLHHLQAEQMAMFMAQGYRDKNNMVFRNATHHLVDNGATNQTLKRVCIAAKTKNVITTHGLRHTHGSILLYQGVDILSVSRRLGHGNIQTTMDTYVHQIDEMRARDDTKINAILAAI